MRRWRGAGFLSKKVFWFLICKKKNKMAHEFMSGIKKIIWPTNREKKLFWTHMMEMILFHLIFPNVC